MSTKALRNSASLGFVAIAIVLAVTSVAYACTAMQGRMEISTSSASTRSVAVADGALAHGYCSVTGGARATSSQTITIEVARLDADDCPASGISGLAPSADPPGGPAWVPCDPQAVGNESCRLGLYYYNAGYGAYEVRLQRNVFSVDPVTGTYTHDPWAFGDPETRYYSRGLVYTGNDSCIDETIGQGADPRWPYQVIGTLWVEADGSGEAEVTLPANLQADLPTDSSGICVRGERNEIVEPPPVPADYTGTTPYYRPDDPSGNARTNQAPITLI